MKHASLRSILSRILSGPGTPRLVQLLPVALAVLAYRDLIQAYLDNSTIATEDAVEDFEAAHPGVADSFYQREVAKGGSNAYHTFV